MRRVISMLIFGIGVAFALAGAAKLTFGIAIALPLLPRVSLEWVNPALMIALALVSFAVAARVGRLRSPDSEGTHRAPAA